MYLFRRATPADLPAMSTIIAEARDSLAALGADQWQAHYPTDAVLLRDIGGGHAYVAESSGLVFGMLSLIWSGEAAYDLLDGAWHTNPPYGTIHRFAVAASCRGSGVADFLLEQAIAECRACGVTALRIDTHADNLPMRRFLARHGFSHCGTVPYPAPVYPREGYDLSIPGHGSYAPGIPCGDA